jgi:hypothetical protein
MSTPAAASSQGGPRFEFINTPFPGWLRFIWYPIAFFIAGPSFVKATLDEDPSAVLYLLLALALIGGWEWWARREGDPGRNYVELADESFVISKYGLWRSVRRFPYSDVDSVSERGTHWLGHNPWPQTTAGRHIDVRLKRAFWRWSGLGTMSPQLPTLHLQVKHHSELLRLLQAKVEAASNLD